MRTLLATETSETKEIIELVMGTEVHLREIQGPNFIKSAIRGDLTFCHTPIDEVDSKGKQFVSVFYANGITNRASQDTSEI